MYINKNTSRQKKSLQIFHSPYKKNMKTTLFNKSLAVMIDFLREIGNLIEVAQGKLEESFCLDENIQSYMANNTEDPDVQILHKIFEKARADDQSMTDNFSFTLGDIHKRIGKYKHKMKDTSTDFSSDIHVQTTCTFAV